MARLPDPREAVRDRGERHRRHAGVHAYVIGVTVGPVGTSLLGRLRGHDDVGLGTLLGSNLFNSLAVVGVTAARRPPHARRQVSEVAVALGFGVLTVLLILPRRGTISTCAASSCWRLMQLS